MKNWIKNFMWSKGLQNFALRKWGWPESAWLLKLRYECSNVLYHQDEVSATMSVRSMLVSLRDRIDRDLKKLEN